MKKYNIFLMILRREIQRINGGLIIFKILYDLYNLKI
jgi:hypothetical protein